MNKYYIIIIKKEKGGKMPAIQIKNVPARIYKTLKEKAKNNHRSVSGEVLNILEKALFYKEQDKQSLFDRIDFTRGKIARDFGVAESSVPWIREDRDI
jgi:plasmid stability protein